MEGGPEQHADRPGPAPAREVDEPGGHERPEEGVGDAQARPATVPLRRLGGSVVVPSTVKPYAHSLPTKSQLWSPATMARKLTCPTQRLGMWPWSA